jgi:hypothetical protein
MQRYRNRYGTTPTMDINHINHDHALRIGDAVVASDVPQSHKTYDSTVWVMNVAKILTTAANKDWPYLSEIQINGEYLRSSNSKKAVKQDIHGPLFPAKYACAVADNAINVPAFPKNDKTVLKPSIMCVNRFVGGGK